MNGGLRYWLGGTGWCRRIPGAHLGFLGGQVHSVEQTSRLDKHGSPSLHGSICRVSGGRHGSSDVHAAVSGVVVAIWVPVVAQVVVSVAVSAGVGTIVDSDVLVAMVGLGCIKGG